MRQARARVRHFHVDARLLRARVQADCHRAQRFPRRARQQMIRRVLLHMVKAPRPVDPPANRLPERHFPLCAVPDHAVRRLNVRHLKNAVFGFQRADVMRLPAGCGVKRRAIQRHPARSDRRDLRFKRRTIRVVVIKPLRFLLHWHAPFRQALLYHRTRRVSSAPLRPDCTKNRLTRRLCFRCGLAILVTTDSRLYILL